MAFTINEDGIYDPETYTMSCTDAMQAGKIFADSWNDIAVGTDSCCKSVFHALAAGIISAGKNIWNLGICTQSQLRYAVRTTGADGGIFIENCCGNIKLIPCSSFGHNMVRSEEKKFMETAAASEKAACEEGRIINSSTLAEMYCTEIQHRFSGLRKSDIMISSSDPAVRKICSSIEFSSSHDHFSTVTFSISKDGIRASAYSSETGYVFYEKLVLICCIDEFEKGNDIALPHSFPVIADRLADEYNRNIYRYDPFSENAADISRREISLEFPFLYDAFHLVNRVVRIMQSRCLSLKGLLEAVPEFTTAVKYVNISRDSDDTIHQIQENSENDVCCRRDTGRIIAKKSRSGKNLILYAESYSSETADELCSSWLSDCGIH